MLSFFHLNNNPQSIKHQHDDDIQLSLLFTVFLWNQMKASTVSGLLDWHF